MAQPSFNSRERIIIIIRLHDKNDRRARDADSEFERSLSVITVR